MKLKTVEAFFSWHKYVTLIAILFLDERMFTVEKEKNKENGCVYFESLKV